MRNKGRIKRKAVREAPKANLARTGSTGSPKQLTPAEQITEVVLREFSPVRKEVTLALERVGTTPAKRLAWVFRFAYQEIAVFSEGALSDLAWDLSAFILGKPFEQAAEDTKWLLHQLFRIIPNFQTGQPTEEQPPRKLPLAFVIECQKALREQLQRWPQSLQWKVKRPESEESLILNIQKDGRFTGVTWNAFGPIFNPQDFLALVFHLLKPEVRRLGICENPKCKKFFVTERKGRAHFCSPSCSAYVRVNKARGKM